MTEKDFIILESRDETGIMTLDNALMNYIEKPDFFDAEKIKDWIEREKLKGLIIQGAGSHFSGGADIGALKILAADASNLLSAVERGKKALSAIKELEIPVIAAIRGACFGGGLEIALTAHIRVSGAGAMFAFPEADLGLMPGLGGTCRLPRIIGTGKSVNMILSGEIIGAEKALELGLIDYLVPKKEVFNFSLELMKRMVSNRSIEVIHSVMRSINNSENMSPEKAMEEESRMFCALAVKEMKKNKNHDDE